VVIADESRTGAIAVFAVGAHEVVTPSAVAAAARLAVDAGWIPGNGRGEVHVATPEG
jgi:hypothetical protein